MGVDNREDLAGELRLIFADGMSAPFAVRELVATIRNPNVLGLTCVFALLLALPGGGAFSEEVPLVARLVLNLFSVALFAVLFPALLQEAHDLAVKRGYRLVPEPAITIPTAIITTLAVEAMTVFVVGHSDLTRWDLALKLGFGAMFWELHITMMLRFMGPTLRAREKAKESARPETETRPAEVRLGNAVFDPAQLLRIETDDHFLIIHHDGGTSRVLASLNDGEERLSRFGIRVHRCHWVASGELGDVQVKGRSYLMRTRSGHEVPVSRDRRSAVKAATAERLLP